MIEARAAAIAARTLAVLPPPGPLPDILYIAIDGTGVPVVAAETEGRDGKARTREVKLPPAHAGLPPWVALTQLPKHL